MHWRQYTPSGSFIVTSSPPTFSLRSEVISRFWLRSGKNEDLCRLGACGRWSQTSYRCSTPASSELCLRQREEKWAIGERLIHEVATNSCRPALRRLRSESRTRSGA